MTTKSKRTLHKKINNKNSPTVSLRTPPITLFVSLSQKVWLYISRCHNTDCKACSLGCRCRNPTSNKLWIHSKEVIFSARPNMTIMHKWVYFGLQPQISPRKPMANWITSSKIALNRPVTEKLNLQTSSALRRLATSDAVAAGVPWCKRGRMGERCLLFKLWL